MKPLVSITPITTWEELRSAFQVVLTHPSLGATAERFRDYIEMDVCDQAVVDCWDSIESDWRFEDSQGVSRGPVTICDLDWSLEQAVDQLVEYNNNKWNFGPGLAPPRLRFEEVMSEVGKVIGQEVTYTHDEE